MSRFNLIDEPWIPVRRKDGSFAELGIKEVLLTAKELSGIEDPSPLVVASLYRFLLAVLYRALEGPTDIDQAKVLFRDGLPADRIGAYLEKWRDRFWLFDEKYPFGQIPDFEPKIWRAWTVLAAENNADNAKVLFDHEDVENVSSISEAKAARGILATQTFSVSCGKSELSHTKTAPSATAMIIVPIGQNLSDTLTMSLTPQARAISLHDRALWEAPPESIPVLANDPARVIAGIADRYTWRTRTIRLRGADDGIRKVAFASGIEADNQGETVDPMLAFKVHEKFGKMPTQFSDRGLWRDFDSLLPDDSGLAPGVVEHSIVLSRRSPERRPRALLVLGQLNAKGKANVIFWRQEMFVLPLAIFGEAPIRGAIRGLLDIAAEAQKAMYSASRQFARDRLSRGEREPATGDIKAFVSQLPGTPAYWSILETRFQEILHAYTLDADPDAIEHQWLSFVRSALKDAWQLQKNSVSGGDAWTLRALVKAEAPILRKLAELNSTLKEYQNQQPEENG